MLTVGSPATPDVLEPAPQRDGSRRSNRSYSNAASATRGRGTRAQSTVEINGVSIDRLTYIGTALEALPGVTLREFFVPIMRFKKRMLILQRNIRERFPSRTTVEGAAAYTKMVTDALTLLTRSLNTAGGDLMLDGGTANLSLDPKEVIASLKDKVTPVSIDAGGVLIYPRELPETSFVYIVVAGTVSATHFQPQLPSQSSSLHHHHRSSGLGLSKRRKTYFTSSKDVVRLCGGGLPQEAVLFTDDCTLANSVVNNTTIASGGYTNFDGASVSNVTTAIQRSLRRASRTAGQPTLRPTHTEEVCGPVVLGAGESLGMAPFKYVCYTASTTASAAPPPGAATVAQRGVKGDGGVRYMEFVNAFCIRTSDVHDAVVHIAAEQWAQRQRRAPHRCVSWCVTAPGEALPRGAVRTVADFIVSARRRSLQTDYAATELLMRHSWLLQDAPAHTIRKLISYLVPRTFMPGEVIACPHSPGSARQLCFLRRGRLNVFVVSKGVDSPTQFLSGEVPDASAISGTLRDECSCWCLEESTTAQPAEVVESGASFGELSVLFREPRQCVLRADTVCDIWCLPHRSFTDVVHRDASLRDGLLQKAAVLRIEWMGEQRFTRALAHQLRGGIQILRALPDVAIRLIQERIEPVIYAPGSLVASTSTKCTEMILIMRGTISTVCKGVATYSAGDVLGEGCLIPHRWPLGLFACTMVEGWRIKAAQVIDALRRMDLLYRYSGLVTSQTPQLMKKVFRSPLPEIEVDDVGRQRMPRVGAPPGGTASYVAYGRAVSEVQLKALCFLYRDYVRWEDINYSSMRSTSANQGQQRTETSLEAVARAVTISRLGGEKGHEISLALSQHQQRNNSGTADGKNQKATVSARGVAAATTPTTASLPGCAGTTTTAAAAAGSGRNAARVNSRSHQVTPQLRAGDRPGPTDRMTSRGAFYIKKTLYGAETPSSDRAKSRHDVSQSAINSRASHTHVTYRHTRLPPRLHRMLRLLEERNRTWASEQYHEAALARQEVNQRGIALRDRGLLTSKLMPRALPRDSNGSRSATATVAPTTAFADAAPAPVHIFLQGERPRYELSLSEAISIGYVMQLPGITEIQHSVSLVDPDVALGPPAQRGRRYHMSVTPNDRHTKHNFLVAASDLEGGDSLSSRQKAEDTQAAAALLSKTRKLFNMMRIAVAPRVDSDAASASAMLRQAVTSSEFPPAETPPGALVPANESQVNSSFASAVTLSPNVTDQHDALPSNHSTVAHAESIMTPSPPCVSPRKNSEERKEEEFHGLLRREPGQAIEMLCKHYSLSCGFTAGCLVSTLTSPTWYAVDGRSVNESDQMMSLVSVSAVSQRRASQSHRLGLVEKLEAVARAGLQSLTSMGELVSPVLLQPRSSSRCPTDAGEGDASLPNAAASFLPLVRATERDRWHSPNKLTIASVPSPKSASSSALLSTKTIKANATSPSSTPIVVAPQSSLVEYFYGEGQRRGTLVLFVEGYGPLQPMPDHLTEYPLAIRNSVVSCGELHVSNDSIDGSSTGGAPVSNLPTAIAAAAALRRRSSRAEIAKGPSRGGSVSVTANANEIYPKREKFVMPGIEDTESFIRHVQRDVEGLNAVAREQRREREEARAKSVHNADYLGLMEATLGKPNAEELEFLEAWRAHYRNMTGEALHLATLPAPLRKEAGQNYVVQELESLANAPPLVESAVQRYAYGVQEWQDQQASRAEGTSLFSGASCVASLSLNASDGVTTSGMDGPRHVVATIGTARLGFTPSPLQSPSSNMSPEDYEMWVRQREDFFAEYRRLLGGDGADGRRCDVSAAAMPVPTSFFTPAPPLLKRSTVSVAPAAPALASPPEAPDEAPVDFRTTMNPPSEHSDVEEGFMGERAITQPPDQLTVLSAQLGSANPFIPTSVPEEGMSAKSALSSLVSSPASSQLVRTAAHMAFTGAARGYGNTEDANTGDGDEVHREGDTTPPWLKL